jgi:hypothetical protein
MTRITREAAAAGGIVEKAVLGDMDVNFKPIQIPNTMGECNIIYK